MRYRARPWDKSIRERCVEDIERQFRYWREPGNPDTPSEVSQHDFPYEPGQTEAILCFVLRGNRITLRCSSQPSYSRNLEQVVYALAVLHACEINGAAETVLGGLQDLIGMPE